MKRVFLVICLLSYGGKRRTGVRVFIAIARYLPGVMVSGQYFWMRIPGTL